MRDNRFPATCPMHDMIGSTFCSNRQISGRHAPVRDAAERNHSSKMPAFMSARSLRRWCGTLALVFAVGAAAASARAQTALGNINLNGRYLDAARAGQLKDVQSLLEQGAAVDSRDRNGDTPLHYAARKGDADMVRVAHHWMWLAVNDLGL